MDNAKAFHEAYGSAFPSNAAFAVKEKELHVLKHDLKRGILEDVAVLGATALSNTTMIGRPTEVVAPDGAVLDRHRALGRRRLGRGRRLPHARDETVAARERRIWSSFEPRRERTGNSRRRRWSCARRRARRRC